MHYRHEVISRVVELWTPQTEVSIEVVNCFLSCSLINQPTLDHEQESIEELKYLTVGLMNSHYDSFTPLLRQILQILHNNERSQRIQTRCRLI